MPDNVTQWLEQLGLGQYADAFELNALAGEHLPDLDHETLKEIGVTAVGHRMTILKAAAKLRLPTRFSRELEALEASESQAGSHLAAWERHPGERKHVTMLFADITGSTALTEKLDAEEAHDLLYGATQRMCSAIENNRGTVCRFMGDGVMAMFGAPLASEQHAVEACEAALDMQQAIRDYAADGGASGLRIRVGLHSGEVVVLTVGEGAKVEYDASGPTVPIAARMEQSAQPGDVYLTAATQSLAANRIETQSLAPVSVKGISEPLPVFSLRRIRSVEEVVPDANRTPFLGRRAELNQFRGMLDTSIEEGHGQTIYVRGEPGIGKTRLVEEFTKIAAEKGASTHRGLVLPFGVGKGQGAIRSLVRSLLNIAPGGGKDARLLAAQTALHDGRLGSDQAVFLFDLLDLPQSMGQKSLYDAMDNTTRNEGKRAVVCALLSIASKNQPTVVTIEDVHWANGLTLAHLSTLTQTTAECAAVFVMTSRIEGDQLDQSWRSTTDGSPFVAIDLGPLRKEDSVALLGDFVNTNSVLAKNCLKRAAGNPLFLEQLLRNAREGTSGSLPDSIQSLVLARLDRLQAVDKKALQAASVLGQRFGVDVLRNLLETHDYDCDELARHNLVRPIVDGFLFTHALIQESVYGSLVKSRRRELHAKAARWFAETDLVLHAEHLAHAQDKAAPGAFLAAAHEQAERYRSESAIALVERGLELAADNDRFPLQCLHGELLRSLGLPKQSIDVYRRAKETANSNIERCRASVGICEGLRIIDAHDELLAELSFAGGIASQHGLSLQQARVHHLRGGVHFLRGETEACIQASQTALTYAEAAESPGTKAQILSGLGDAEYLRGRLISANRYFDQCIEISRGQGFGKILVANLLMRGIGYHYQNLFVQALRDFEDALSLSKETAQPRAEMLAPTCGFYIFQWGDVDEGERLLTQSMELARRLGSALFIGWAFIGLGRIAYLKGFSDEAASLAQQAVATLRDGGMAFAGPRALGVLALATKNNDQRRSALSEAEALLRGKSVSHNYMNFYPDAMETCLKTGQWDEVDRFALALENYTSAEPLPLSDLHIARGRALAAVGRGQRDDATVQEVQRVHDEAQRIGLKFVIPALVEALALL